MKYLLTTFTTIIAVGMFVKASLREKTMEQKNTISAVMSEWLQLSGKSLDTIWIQKGTLQ